MSIFACGKKKYVEMPEKKPEIQEIAPEKTPEIEEDTDNLVSFEGLRRGKFIRVLLGNLNGACLRVKNIGPKTISLTNAMNELFLVKGNGVPYQFTITQAPSASFSDAQNETYLIYETLTEEEQQGIESAYRLSPEDLVKDAWYFVEDRGIRVPFKILEKLDDPSEETPPYFKIFCPGFRMRNALFFDDRNRFRFLTGNANFFCYKMPKSKVPLLQMCELLEKQPGNEQLTLSDLIKRAEKMLRQTHGVVPHPPARLPPERKEKKNDLNIP